MKRLLAYLFIVLGLGFTFSVNADENYPKVIFCENPKDNEPSYFYEKIIYQYSNKVTCADENRDNAKIISVEDFIYENLVKILNPSFLTYYSISYPDNPSSEYLLDQLFSMFRVYKDYGLDESLIAKIASTEERFYVLKEALEKNGHKLNKALLGKKLSGQTQIAKAEPSQTQQINIVNTGYILDNFIFVLFLDKEKCKINLKGFDSIIRNINYEGSWEQFPCKYKEYKNSNGIFELTGIFPKRQKWGTKNYLLAFNGNKVVVTDAKLGVKYINQVLNGKRQSLYKGVKKELTLSQIAKLPKITKSQIAKAEPTTIPKKKVKLAKKEPKQEEFKPKKTNQDNEAPVIEIAEAITVNDTDYEFQGKVTDQAKTIYVEVDGRPTDVKNGKFIVKGYSPIDKQISIEAIDQWGNRSEPKIVKLTIDIKNTSIAEKLEPLNPSKIRSKSSNNKVALIIGIENYLESPNAKYANLDAKYFFDYARKGFGVKKQNINLLVDEQATFVKTNKALTKWLRSKIKSGQSDLIIFFAGHGLASSDGKELYLLPQDSDPDLLARTALSRTELFQEIINLNPKSVTMFLDTCYSGVSRDEQMLLASARPIRIVADEQSEIPNNFTIFSASKLDQISSGLKEANHGIFSYYLMKGLEGNADSNEDKKITNGELLAYMDLNVSQKASELGRQQNPSLSGDPDKVLMSYR